MNLNKKKLWKPTEPNKVKRRYWTAAGAAVLCLCCATPAMAAGGDPLDIVNNLSDFISLENFFENFFRNFAKTAPSIRDRSERGRKPTSRCMRGGEQLLELTPSQKKTVRHQFDSFCRKVLREEARDYERHIAWRSNHEVSLSELSEELERQMYVLDEYPSEQTHFHVQGYDVAIENEDLANALTVLPDDKRDIVLLAYFLDMTDQEIADKLDMVRRTVQCKRAQSLKELKKWRLRKMARNLSNTAASLLPYSTIEAAASGNVDAINGAPAPMKPIRD